MPVSARFLSPSLTRLPGSHSILIFVCVCNGNVQIYMSLIFILWFTSQPLLWPFIKMRLLCACSMFMLVSNKPNGINTHTHTALGNALLASTSWRLPSKNSKWFGIFFSPKFICNDYVHDCYNTQLSWFMHRKRTVSNIFTKFTWNLFSRQRNDRIFRPRQTKGKKPKRSENKPSRGKKNEQNQTRLNSIQ